jgi:hypothetical protein
MVHVADMLRGLHAGRSTSFASAAQAPGTGGVTPRVGTGSVTPARHSPGGGHYRGGGNTHAAAAAGASVTPYTPGFSASVIGPPSVTGVGPGVGAGQSRGSPLTSAGYHGGRSADNLVGGPNGWSLACGDILQILQHGRCTMFRAMLQYSYWRATVLYCLQAATPGLIAAPAQGPGGGAGGRRQPSQPPPAHHRRTNTQPMAGNETALQPLPVGTPGPRTSATGGGGGLLGWMFGNRGGASGRPVMGGGILPSAAAAIIGQGVGMAGSGSPASVGHTGPVTGAGVQQAQAEAGRPEEKYTVSYAHLLLLWPRSVVISTGQQNITVRLGQSKFDTPPSCRVRRDGARH